MLKSLTFTDLEYISTFDYKIKPLCTIYSPRSLIFLAICLTNFLASSDPPSSSAKNFSLWNTPQDSQPSGVIQASLALNSRWQRRSASALAGTDPYSNAHLISTHDWWVLPTTRLCRPSSTDISILQYDARDSYSSPLSEPPSCRGA